MNDSLSRHSVRICCQICFAICFWLATANAQTTGREIPGVAKQTLRSNQSKVFWHDGFWWGLFVKSGDGSNRYIYKYDNGNWVESFLYDNSLDEVSYVDGYIESKLDLLFIVDTAQSRFWRLEYNNSTKNWSLGVGPVAVTTTSNNNHAGCITRANNGRLFIFTSNTANSLQGQFSDDNGATWQFFDILNELNSRSMTDAVAFRDQQNDYIGLVLGENSNSPEFRFFKLKDGDDPAIPGNWVEEGLNYGYPEFTGDNHVSIIKDFEQNLYLVGKYGGLSPAGVTFALFRRSISDGNWSVFNVQAPGGTRPALSLDETNDKLYIFATLNNSIQYVALDRNSLRDIVTSDWIPIIQHDTDGFNDLSVSYQQLTATSDVMVIAANDSAGSVWCNILPLNAENAHPLVISEVNSAGNIDASFVEIYNTTALAINLTGYSMIYSDDDNPSPATQALSGTIDGFGYKVICRNATAFAAEYDITPDFTNPGFTFDGGSDGIALIADDPSTAIDYFNAHGNAKPEWSPRQLFERNLIPNNGENIYIDYNRSGIAGAGTPRAPNLTNRPAVLTSFSATVADSRVNLHWVSAAESGNLEWIIDRRESTEPEFREIGRMPGVGDIAKVSEYDYPDGAIFSNSSYEYRLSSIDSDGQKIAYRQIVRVVIAAGSIEDFQLYANYPNPFNNETNIRFRVGELLQARLIVYDINGQAVKTLFSGELNPGEHIYRWNSTDNFGNTVASGFYLVRLRTDNFTKTIKMILAR